MIEMPEGFTMTADRDHTHRILVNLLTNAVRYGQPPVVIRASAVEGAARIEVEDSGSGVPADFVPHLFEKFRRASDAEGDHLRGSSGLGLAIVRGLAEANGGTASYRGSVSGGAIFEVEFPLASG